MSESTTQAELQAVMRTLASFAEDDVTIGDWRVLDKPVSHAPYAIIRRSRTVRTSKASLGRFQVTWAIPVVLVVAFVDWDQAESDLGDLRQDVLNLLLVTSPKLGAAPIESVSTSDFDEIYNTGDSGPYPAFLSQELTITVTELV